MENERQIERARDCQYKRKTGSEIPKFGLSSISTSSFLVVVKRSHIGDDVDERHYVRTGASLWK